jgi:hypothetical protein
LERLDNLFSKYFLTMEVTVTEEGQEMKRRPKLGYAKKIRSGLKSIIRSSRLSCIWVLPDRREKEEDSLETYNEASDEWWHLLPDQSD